jgi:hypothetical protein
MSLVYLVLKNSEAASPVPWAVYFTPVVVQTGMHDTEEQVGFGMPTPGHPTDTGIGSRILARATDVPLGRSIICVLFFCCFGLVIGHRCPPRPPLDGSGSKNGAART